MYQSILNVNTDDDGQEIRVHGTFAYPVACYFDDMSRAKIISHWHAELELIFVTQGEVLVGAGQTEKILHAGDACFINANVLHDVRQVESRAGVLKSIVFHPRFIGTREDIFWIKFLRPLIDDKRKEFIFFDAQRDSQIVSQTAAAWAAQAEELRGFEFDVRNFLSQVVREISSGGRGKIYSPTPAQLRDTERVKQMITFIEKNYAEDITLDQIAAAAFISRIEANRCFKRATGLPPKQFLIKYRILLAAERLRSTRQSISDVAAGCGFLDMSYFAKAFRDVFDETPTDYRKNLEMIK